MKVNLATRKESLQILKDGGCVVVFPAGGVSTSPTFFARTAVDDEWKPFTAKMITQSGAHVTPLFFEGQNSRLYQWASHISSPLRLALMFREVKRRMGTVLPVHIGETLSPEDLQNAGKRAEMMNYLRNKTYGMASEAHQAKIRKAAKRMAARERKPVSLR